MPIFARNKLLLEDRCLTMRPSMEFSYSGPNPDKAYPKLIDILTSELQVPRENIQEKSFQWDRSGPEEKFSASFEVMKDVDKFTYIYLEIDMRGSMKPSKELGKEGTMRLKIGGMVRTEYPQDTLWEKSFFYEMMRTFWHRVFYKDRRYKWLSECRDSMLLIQDRLKEFFNLLTKARY
ncbi:MAG: hypothetical protein JW701_00545 [Kosmotogaceae bacterium]|nr:hypothetical protein [Kosmotogaceae bacterium]